MSLSRRRFLEVGTLVAASSAVLPLQALENNGLSATAIPAEKSSSFHHLSAEQFRGVLNTTFSVDAGLGRPLFMELVKVEEFPVPAGPPVAGECFSLDFRLASGSHVPQGTYAFEHATVGKDALLIVPAKQSPAHYVAVINRRHRVSAA